MSSSRSMQMRQQQLSIRDKCSFIRSASPQHGERIRDRMSEVEKNARCLETEPSCGGDDKAVAGADGRI